MVIWSESKGGCLYEIRAVGRVRRLYSNGILHSQVHLDRPLTGYVWDLLMLPAFFYSAAQINRVLVLGLGGGTVIKALNHFFQPSQITAVELNPVHVHVARHHFQTLDDNVQIVESDAIDWVNQYQGQGFDLVIDDLFGDTWRAVAVDTPWLSRLLALSNPGGLMTFNFVSKDEVRASALTGSLGRRRFRSVFQLTLPTEENIVVAALKKGVKTTQLRPILAADPRLRNWRGELFRIRCLQGC